MITTPATKLHMKFAKEGVISPNAYLNNRALAIILGESGDEGKRLYRKLRSEA